MFSAWTTQAFTIRQFCLPRSYIVTGFTVLYSTNRRRLFLFLFIFYFDNFCLEMGKFIGFWLQRNPLSFDRPTFFCSLLHCLPVLDWLAYQHSPVLDWEHTDVHRPFATTKQCLHFVNFQLSFHYFGLQFILRFSGCSYSFSNYSLKMRLLDILHFS